MEDTPYSSIFPALQPLRPYVEEPQSSPGSQLDDSKSLKDLLDDLRADKLPGDEQTCRNDDFTLGLESMPDELCAEGIPSHQESSRETNVSDQEPASNRSKITNGNWRNRTLEEHFVPDSVGYRQLDRLAEPGFENYGLRLGPRLGNLVPSCFIDQDHTENFDPQKPNIFDILPQKRKRESIYEDGYAPPPRIRPRGPKIYTYQYGRKMGKSLIVHLKFNTESGKTFFPLLGQDSGLPLESPGSNDSGFYSAATSDNNFAERRCRKVEASRRSNDEDEDCDGILKLEDLTLGHPAARGCKACFELGLQCDLLHEGSSYPCTLCLRDGEECELITPPLKKRGCEGCKKRRIGCSYRHEGSDHGKACDNCALKGYSCIAGPLTGRTRTGPSLDQSSSLLSELSWTHPTPADHYEQVEEASKTPDHRITSDRDEVTIKAEVKFRSRQRLISAMFKPRPGSSTLLQEQPKTIASVRQQRIHQILTPVPRQEHNAPTKSFYVKPKPSEKKQQSIRTVGGIWAPLPKVSRYSGYIVTNPYSLPTPPSTPSPSGSLSSDAGPAIGLPGKVTITSRKSASLSHNPATTPLTKKIRTRLAHPIQLNIVPPHSYPGDPTTSNDPACHFHPISPHSILGLPVATPVVIDSPKGDGYTEISGGHIEDGYAATRMCGSCVRERVRIIECGKHELEPLPHDQTYHGEAGQYLRDLMSGTTEWKWCHVCAAPAEYKCSKTRTITSRACGLCLCETCTMRVVGEFDGQLEEFVRKMMEENDEGMGFGVRPDVEMLSKKGEVARRFGRGILRTLL